jgi:ATP-binding cassette subfamily B protein
MPLSPGAQPTTWREKLGVLRTLTQLLGLVWQTHRALTAAMIALRLARGVVPVATLWVGKLIIDAVVRGVSGAGVGGLWRYVALEIAIVLGGELLARASALTESLLGDLFSNFVSIRLMVHSATLDLTQFEDPATYDHLERARQQTTGRIALLAQLFSMAQDAITLATLAIVLVAYSPWLLLLLVAAVFPSFLGETHYAALSYSLLFRRTPERRELDYLRFVGASVETA